MKSLGTTRRLIKAQEEERQRIARELHDDIGNRIALIAMSLRRFIREPQRPGLPTHELSSILDDLTLLSTALRDLSHDLQPPVLVYGGLKAALRWLQEKFSKTGAMKIDLSIPAHLPALPKEVELCIFRIAQEALQNAARHSNAESASVTFHCSPQHLRLAVVDTGCGFARSQMTRTPGLGLVSMEARALSIHGQLAINSVPGMGTAIVLTVAMPKTADHERTI